MKLSQKVKYAGVGALVMTMAQPYDHQRLGNVGDEKLYLRRLKLQVNHALLISIVFLTLLSGCSSTPKITAIVGSPQLATAEAVTEKCDEEAYSLAIEKDKKRAYENREKIARNFFLDGLAQTGTIKEGEAFFLKQDVGDSDWIDWRIEFFEACARRHGYKRVK